ncbi:MAG: alpha-amylase family glycosyl hydrolase, partial [Dehalococcoidia bacterium]
MRIPTATYRVQCNASFGFTKARELVSYLGKLGVSDLYTSPIVAARPGSAHGYDVIDPTRLNPELGSEAEFQALADELRARNMGLLLDIVPNHMSATPDNPWWAGVLRDGPSSPYAAFFDIDWDAADGKLVLPVLGRPYREALAGGEL